MKLYLIVKTGEPGTAWKHEAGRKARREDKEHTTGGAFQDTTLITVAHFSEEERKLFP